MKKSKSMFLAIAAMVLLCSSGAKASNTLEGTLAPSRTINSSSPMNILRTLAVGLASIGGADAFKPSNLQPGNLASRQSANIGNQFSKYSVFLAQKNSEELAPAESKKECPITNLFGKKDENEALRIKIPFFGPAFVIVSKPNQIDEIITSPLMHMGVLSEPKMPAWLLAITEASVAVTCPAKKQGFVLNVEPEFNLYREERLQWHDSRPMMAPEDIDILAKYIRGTATKDQMLYTLFTSVYAHLTDLKPTEDIFDLSKSFTKDVLELKLFRIEDARKKLIDWNNQASEQYKNIEMPRGVDPIDFKQNLAADLFPMGPFAIGLAGPLVEEAKKELEKNNFSIEHVGDFVRSLLFSKTTVPTVFRVAKESGKIASLPFDVEKGDVIVIQLGNALKISNNWKYLFLNRCGGGPYIENFMLRSVQKAIEMK